MKKKLLIIAGLTSLLLAGCGSGTKATIVIFNDSGKEMQRIQVDDYSDYSDGRTKYWIKDEKHVLKGGIPHEIITKADKDDE